MIARVLFASAIVLALALTNGVNGQTPSPPGSVSLRQVGVWSIQPTNPTCRPGDVIQFASFVPASYSGAVTWSATGGTITAQGLYTAPSTPGDYWVEARIGRGLRARSLVKVAPRQGSTTDPADRFVDSVGVNIHLHYDDTLYRQNFALTKTRLLELGVRHVRDGLVDTTWQPFYDRHNELGRAGIKGVFIAPVGASSALLQDYPARVPSAFEGYEAPNEHDLSNDPRWLEALRDSLASMRTLKNIPALAGFPILGPSLTTEGAYAALGDVSAEIDLGNMHNYFSGYNPGTLGWGPDGYGSIEWNLRVARQVAGGKPIVSTETGYFTDPAVADRVPEDVAGKYMPRLLLEQFRLGIMRTYIYELADEAGQRGRLGLLAADGTHKPAFRAVANLLTLLADPGAAFSARPLQYSVSGGNADVRVMSFQKRNGRFYLVIWLESPGYDVTTGRVMNVPSQSVTLTLRDNVRLENTYQWQASGDVVRVPAQGSQQTMTVTVTDTLQMLEFQP